MRNRGCRMKETNYSVRRMRERTGEHDVVSALTVLVILLVLIDLVMNRL